MSLPEFTEGYVFALLRNGFASLNVLRRDLTRDDLTNSQINAIRNNLSPFWNTYGADILASTYVPPGWPGASPISRHAGHQFAQCRNGKIAAFNASDWGEVLADAMTATAHAAGRCILTSDAAANVTIVYPEEV